MPLTNQYSLSIQSSKDGSDSVDWSLLETSTNIVPQLEAKLRNIEGNIIPKSDQLKFYNDIRQCCKKIDDSKVCNKQENKTQV
ncbi:hypothetical protein DOY81_008977, partial [Sarcophaga bullata]